MNRIAVVGMACRYPDASSPAELWENAIAGRRAFRQLPDVRMRLEDYWSATPGTPDRFYAATAAVLEGYSFDRVAHKIAGSTYRSTDLTHWLALDVAGRALCDGGFAQGDGLPRERTGVIVGNTLTGEFTRANLMRLRWPYVRRTVAAALREQEWDDERLALFLDDLEVRYKDPFPPVDEDTLAGGLSNTIAGRICNYFDFKGGGYTVDGACSSSLLAVTTGCRALADGDLDVAIAGGVDLSIDPFEIVGFAMTGALARSQMRVYDRASNGFWPGEGCGMLVLMRERDAVALGRPGYATIAGWGISSDGKGSITRPEISGYRLALSRAYERAGFGIESVALFEGHGTGTQVGDTTELAALSQARLAALESASAIARAAAPAAAPAAIGSIKGMIGHTKAAAGAAGLIKAVLAVQAQVLPPAIGCVEPHELVSGGGSALRVLRQAEAWPRDLPVRAGVTAMGFGGINTHVVVEGAGPRLPGLDARTRRLSASAQDAELIALDAASAGELRTRLGELADWVPGLSYAELADLASAAQDGLSGLPWRAAVVASSPQQAAQLLRDLADRAGDGSAPDPGGPGLLGQVTRPARVGFLFPGQGSGHRTSGGALRRRFPQAGEVYASAGLPACGDLSATRVAQPRIVTGSAAGLRVLGGLGLSAAVAVGHSLGELTALHWAGSIDEQALLRVARIRGQAMTEHSEPGVMASIAVAPALAESLISGLPVVIAGYNGPAQTVISGSPRAVRDAGQRAADAGLPWTLLPVSHAFHSPLVSRAAGVFAGWLASEPLGPVKRRVISTVTGEVLEPDADLSALLRRQITAPVLFSQAVALAAGEVDLFVEVGPGRVLTSLAHEITGVAAVALDTDDTSLTSLLRTAATAWVLGAPVDLGMLFRGRLTRPLEIGRELAFLASPCEKAPAVRLRPVSAAAAPALPPGAGSPRGAAVPGAAVPGGETGDPGEATIEILRRRAAERAELPVELVSDDSRLLDDLHLSSITVGQLVSQAAMARGIGPAMTPANFATATLRELADALDTLADTGLGAVPARVISGIAPWVRAFTVDLDEVPPPPGRSADDPARPAGGSGEWQVHAPGHEQLAGTLRQALCEARVGGGFLVVLPRDCAAAQLEPAFEAARQALSCPPGTRFVLAQHGRGAAGLAKTLHLEAPQLLVTVVQAPLGPAVIERIVTEVAGTAGYAEAHYDDSGRRLVPTLRSMPVLAARPVPLLGGADVLLVTGGGKGITAECALALADDSGASLAILGRSDPEHDPELAANLARMSATGADVCYLRADVTDPGQVRRAVEEATRTLGPVTGVLHGAGRNEPAALSGLDAAELRRTMAPKIDGLSAVLDAVDPARLKLLITFGSIIGRCGLNGEAHYAVANEWLAALTQATAERLPQCRCLCLEWSVWSGTGMGERLSVVESLARDDITAITTDQGVSVLRRLVADPDAPVVVVISGRTGVMDTIRRDEPELPILRFTDRPLVRYHGIELVCETELNPGTDRYLPDHELDGNLLFPAVFGLEAMTQVGLAAAGRRDVPVIERAEFHRPIVVPPDGHTVVRVVALVTGPDTVEAAIRSAETGFAADHFRATLRFGREAVPAGPPDQLGDGVPMVRLDPAADLYGRVLFQGRRFQRLTGYHRAAARAVDADVAAGPGSDWFADYLPGQLLLGDPGVRDALMHGNQVCVPDATLLPVGIDRLYPGGALAGSGTLRYCAAERHRDGDTYTYDIALRTGAGQLIERWEGLRLRAVRTDAGRGPWVIPLLGPYLERAIEDLTGTPVAIVTEPVPGGGLAEADTASRRKLTALAASRAVGAPAEVRYRPDGRPEIGGGRVISASHCRWLTLCAVAAGTVACDVEVAAARSPRVWADLLGFRAGLAELLASELGDPPEVARTRVWAAIECLQKAGLPPGAPLTAATPRRPGWAVLAAGSLRIATFVTSLRDVPDQVVFAVLAEEGRS